MIAIGAGGLDVAVAMAGYPYEIACPEVVEVRLDGKLQRPWVQAKDIILELLRQLTSAAARTRSSSSPARAPPTSRARAGTIANMIAELGATAAVFPPDDSTRDWLAASSARTTSRRSAPTTAPSTTTAWRSTSASWGRSWPSRTTRTTSCRSRRWPARRWSRCASARRSTRRTWTSRCPARCSPTRTARSSPDRCTATATPGSRQILAAIAESGVYRQLVEGGVRMLEPVCGPCVGMGQAPPSDANSLRTFNRNFQGRCGTPEDSRLPVLAGRRRGVDARGQDLRPARVRRRRPRCSRCRS